MIRNERAASFAGMVLGSLWSYTLPLSQVLIYYFLIKVVFGRSAIPGVDPFITIVVGVMNYTVVNQVLNSSCGAILNRSHILLHTRLEPAVFVALDYFKELRKGAEYLAIMVVVYIFFIDHLHYGIFLYPIILAFLLASLWGPCLILAIGTVYLRDLGPLTRTVLRIGIYLCPVIYHASVMPERYWPIYYLNPLAGVFAWIQWSLVGGPAPPVWPLGVSLLFSVAMFILAHWIYAKRSQRLARRF